MNKKKGAPDEVGTTGQPASHDTNADAVLSTMGNHWRVFEWRTIWSNLSLQKITLAEETEMGWRHEGSRETSQVSPQKMSGTMSITLSEVVSFPFAAVR